jgi:adenylate cyclase
LLKGAITKRGVHLTAGLVMFSYVSCHLINHAFGVVSLEFLETTRQWLTEPWTGRLGTYVLLTAILTHISLALWTTFSRRTLKLPLWQWVQLILGLSIPFLLIKHALFTAGAAMIFDTHPTYAYVLAFYWHFAPEKMWIQVTLLVVAWSHACIGLHHWLKFKSWYSGAKPYLYALAVMIPLAALLGFVSAGVEVSELAKSKQWVLAMAKEVRYPGRALEVFVERAVTLWSVGFGVTIVLIFIFRWVSLWVLHRKSSRVTYYPSGKSVRLLPGASVLEASKSADISHSSVCGGRGRCSTCRVHITNGLEGLPPPNSTEAKILDRINAPPGMRLACQLKPTADIEVEPLIPFSADPRKALQAGRYQYGREVMIAILFADLRGFTQLSEKKLPYDVVYLLNSYFASMGEAITVSGGKIDKFIGDGIMALFGLENGPEDGCRAALRAARRMSEQLETLNQSLAQDLKEPLRIVLGIHVGPVIVGEMGYGEAFSMTAIGDAVNTASRLESLAKELDAQLVFSSEVGERAGVDASAWSQKEVIVRGRVEPLNVTYLKSCQDLPHKV